MKLTLTFVCAVLMAGCGVRSQVVRLPSGDEGQAITCNGNAHSWTDCYVKAGEVCPHGYDIADRGSETGWVAGGSASQSGAYSGATAIGGTTRKREMLIRCKGAK